MITYAMKRSKTEETSRNYLHFFLHLHSNAINDERHSTTILNHRPTFSYTSIQLPSFLLPVSTREFVATSPQTDSKRDNWTYLVCANVC